MPVLSYTTTVNVARTMNDITDRLVRAGARQVLTEYGTDGEPIALSFALETAGGLQTYSLPANVDRVLALLRKQKVTPKYRTPEQAGRVGWRIILHWVEAQLAIIETGLVEADRVFMPYAITGPGRTAYADFISQKALPR